MTPLATNLYLTAWGFTIGTLGAFLLWAWFA